MGTNWRFSSPGCGCDPSIWWVRGYFLNIHPLERFYKVRLVIVDIIFVARITSLTLHLIQTNNYLPEMLVLLEPPMSFVDLLQW